MRALTDKERDTVAENLGLCVQAVRRVGVPEPEVDEALQDAVFGLMTAARKFDPDRGYQFSTYAVPCIRSAITRGRHARADVNFRAHAIGRRHGDYAAPLSLDHGEGELGRRVSSETADPAHTATVRAELDAALTRMLRACEDDFDVALLGEIIARGDVKGAAWAVARRTRGLAGETAVRRVERLCAIGRGGKA